MKSMWTHGTLSLSTGAPCPSPFPPFACSALDFFPTNSSRYNAAVIAPPYLSGVSIMQKAVDVGKGEGMFFGAMPLPFTRYNVYADHQQLKSFLCLITLEHRNNGPTHCPPSIEAIPCITVSTIFSLLRLLVLPSISLLHPSDSPKTNSSSSLVTSDT